METAIITALITFLGGVVVASITFWLTKQKEREAEWRKEKLAYYKSLIESLSGIVDGDSSPDGQRSFAKATNNILLFAPQSVIGALNEFRQEIRVSNSKRTLEEHDRLLAILLLAIRRDIGVSPEDDPGTFKPMLWASGASENGAKAH